MGSVILIVLAVLAVLLLLAYLKARQGRKGTGNTTRYYGTPVLSEVEQTLFHRLREAWPEMIVLAQVAMPAMVNVRKPINPEYWTLFNAIRGKHVDFVICNPDFSVRAVVELDDGTHEREDRKKSDEIKDATFAAIGMPLMRFHVRSMPSVEQIRSQLSDGAKLQS